MTQKRSSLDAILNIAESDPRFCLTFVDRDLRDARLELDGLRALCADIEVSIAVALAAAYQRGQEAMRERAESCIVLDGNPALALDRIRALQPEPEQP